MPHNSCCSRKSGAAEFYSNSAVNQYAPNKVIEPIRHDISLQFQQLSTKCFMGKTTLTFKHNGKALVSNARDLQEIRLNAVDFEDVKVSGEGLKQYHYSGHHILLVWDTCFNKEEERKVTIEYTVENPVAGVYFDKDDDMINATAQWAVTYCETEKARYWLPTVDFPTVRTSLTYSITAPKEYISLANGSLESTEVHGEMKTTKWKLDYPCPSYLLCFAVGEFIEVDDGEVNGMPIKYYAAKGYKGQDVKRAFGKTASMVQWLQKKVGVAFPWPKYYQISLPGLRSAMENISLVTWVDTFIQDETLALERQLFTDCVNIHEMGHTYFGDLLVIRHFEHVWLKESWATYIESCWLQDNVSKDEFCYEMYQNACGYFEECRKYMRPIVTRRYDHSWDMFDRHTYPGGAWRIHMLRQLLGDEAFWMGVHIYVERFAKKTVQTSDFQNCLEEASGLNLTRFFEEWIYSKGYPALKGQYSYNDLQNNTVTLTLTQTQHMNQADIPLFGFDIEVMIKTNKDSECTCLLTFDRAATVTACIALPKGEKPAQVLIDPHNKILHTLDMPSVDRDVLINTAKSCPHLVQRIWAYSELIQSGSRPALKAVRELIKQESFYGVRIECAKKLSELNSVFSLEILSELLDNEKEPMAMAPIAEACRHKDDHLRYALRRMLDKSATLPYRAHAYALIALGCQQNADDLPFLLEVAKDENKVGQHGIIRGGALKALGFHRSKEAFEYLLGRVGYHKEPLRSRPMAIQGLAHAAEWQSDRLRKAAIEELASLTRDPNIQIRMEAVEALVQLRANTYADAIEATKHMYPVDDWPWMDRQLRALNNADGDLSEIGLQKKAIEKLENRVKELEEALSAQKA